MIDDVQLINEPRDGKNRKNPKCALCTMTFCGVCSSVRQFEEAKQEKKRSPEINENRVEVIKDRLRG